MREILFRGKQIDGKWVKGPSIVNQPDGWYIFPEDGVNSPDFYKVDPNTIGQYVGLKAKNEKIFQGDVVKWDDLSNGEYWRVAIVMLMPDIQFHCLDCPAIANSSAHGSVFRYANFAYPDTQNHLHIIGNIHDNPELLNQTS